MDRRFVTYPIYASIGFSVFILISIILTAIEQGGARFYFTLLYEFPHGSLLETWSYITFMIGYIGILATELMSFHAEFMTNKNKNRVSVLANYVGGLLAVLTSFLLIPFPGGLVFHAVFATIATIVMFLYIIVRLFSLYGYKRVIVIILLILSFIFGFLTFIFWQLLPDDLFFSIFQVIMGALLFLSLTLSILFYTDTSVRSTRRMA